ncbi:MAG: transporter substrate-binding domain-containing protein, partial [Porphyromonas sp.]|nr:transporter substrate-binding domain-containing protein [Porphyromonas sp.]
MRIGTTTSPSAFFIYRGKEMGAEFFKIRDFVADKGLQLEIKLSHSLDTLKKWIQQDSIDLCIAPLAMTKEHMEEFAFCGPIRTSSLVLLQSRSAEKVQSVLDLADKQIHVVRNSVEDFRIKQLDDEIGPKQDFAINYVDTLSVPDLLTLVCQDGINYTVADEDLARMYAQHYKGIDIKTKLSTPIRYGWIAHKHNTSLADTLELYFSDKKDRNLEQSMNYLFYFGGAFRNPIKIEIPEGNISPYDELF